MKLQRTGMLFCMIGPAGGGKTTFTQRLLSEQHDSTHLSVSVTTRTARPSERDGSSYFFVTPEQFEARIQQGDFFEWEEIHGHRYGTLKTTVDRALAGHSDLLLDIDIRGALRFKKVLPLNTVVVFLVPPSVSILKARLIARGSISPTELATRLATAEREYKTLLELADQPGAVDYFVVNDEAEETYRNLQSILTAERSRLIRISKDQVRSICTL
ncbi:MAG: guanylate kinase [Deltaproteobacteria bacterium]|nr:guanylate kinase [Deltaproteobacteria bacterium]